MKGVILVQGQRMTWSQIQKEYPSQWVGLVDCDMEDDINIRSAVVKYTEKDISTKSETL